MSGVKHTPGPWFGQAGFSDDVEITAESREGMVAICSMELGFTGRIGVEQEANARLIALSPDMFDYILSSAQNGCATAQQIIARARGEQDGGGE
ncbi:hypothetical protein [Brevundimonas diminuta]